jgi:DNA-binding transcriptional MerR regulator
MYNLYMSKNLEQMKPFLVFLGDWYDLQFAEFSYSDEQDFTLVRRMLFEAKHTVAQTGETYRVINNWDAKGLLFDNDERENRWRKFSLTELVWIECLGELRKMGFPVSTLKALRDNLFVTQTTKNSAKFNPMVLAFFIAQVIGREDAILVVNHQGIGSFCTVADYESSQLLYPLPTSYAVVSLNSIYAKLKDKPEYARKNTPLFVLSEKEQDVLEKILFEPETEINLKAKDGKITKVDYKSKKINPENVVAEVREMLKDGKRKEIVIKQENGKAVFIERTDKT